MQGWVISHWGQDALEKSGGSEFDLTYQMLKISKDAPFDLKFYTPDEIELVASTSAPTTWRVRGQKVSPPDFVVPFMDFFYEKDFYIDPAYFAYYLALIQQVENQGIYVVNPSRSIAIARDKFLTLQALSQSGLNVPKTVLLCAPYNLDNIEETIEAPFVVKSLGGSSGNGVYLCQTKKELEELIKFARSCGTGDNLVLQEYIAESKGIDIRIESVGGKIVRCLQRTAREGFKANTMGGATKKEIPADSEMHAITRGVYASVPLDLVGIDLLLTRRGYVISELNESLAARKNTAVHALFAFLHEKLVHGQASGFKASSSKVNPISLSRAKMDCAGNSAHSSA